MNKNDFRYLRRGKILSDLKESDFKLLQPVNICSKKTGRALLFLHGFSSSPAVYRYLIPQIEHYDAIACPALPGHGKSIEDFAQVTAADWVTCAQKACDDLFKKYKKIDVVGLSMGGLLTCKLSEHFAFNHLFLLAPALKLNMNVTSQLKLARALHHLGFKELRGSSGNILSNEHAEISYKRLPINAVIEMLNMVMEHQWVAPSCPVDLFLGTHDAVVSSPKVEQLFCHLPNVTIHWLDNSAHVLPLDNDLQQIITCINKS